MVVDPVELKFKAVGHEKSAVPGAAINWVEEAVEESASVKLVVNVVPEGEKVLPDTVKVTIKELAAKSITFAAPEESLANLKVKLDPTSEQN